MPTNSDTKVICFIVAAFNETHSTTQRRYSGTDAETLAIQFVGDQGLARLVSGRAQRGSPLAPFCRQTVKLSETLSKGKQQGLVQQHQPLHKTNRLSVLGSWFSILLSSLKPQASTPSPPPAA
ncbi:MAG: hypothetical protein OHK0022_40150 [Roseiflexaceae bacterium]